MRQIDSRRTDRLAGLAVEAIADDGSGVFSTVVEVRQDESDGPDVDVTIVVSAHELIDWADVGARTAADAAQCLGKKRVAGQGEAAVVEEDDVHFLAAIRTGGAGCRARDPGHVGRDELTGGVARQHPENAQGALEVWQELVKANQGDVNARQRGDEASVALVGDNPDRSRLGDGEIGSGDAHIGLEECLAKLLPGDLDHAVDVFGVLVLSGHLREKLGDLTPGEMDGRHDHVRRAFMAELDDPFAEVRLGDDKPFFLQVIIEEGFLGGHGFALDDGFYAIRPGNLGDDTIRLVGRLGDMHLDARTFGACLENGKQFFEMGD